MHLLALPSAHGVAPVGSDLALPAGLPTTSFAVVRRQFATLDFLTTPIGQVAAEGQLGTNIELRGGSCRPKGSVARGLERQSLGASHERAVLDIADVN